MSEADSPPSSAGKPKEEQVQGHCPRCGPKIWANVVGHHNVHDSDHSGVWADYNYRILKCAGCRTVYFEEVYVFSEDYDYQENPVTGEAEMEYNPRHTYYPSPSKRKPPDWFEPIAFDSSLYDLMDETYRALDADAKVLAATGARTVFDRASELLGVDPAITFKEKLGKLFEIGKISDGEKIHLDVLTDAGGAAAHRGWKPSDDEITTIMNIAENFVFRNFILENKVNQLKGKIPPKQKRKQA